MLDDPVAPPDKISFLERTVRLKNIIGHTTIITLTMYEPGGLSASSLLRVTESTIDTIAPINRAESILFIVVIEIYRLFIQKNEAFLTFETKSFCFICFFRSKSS